MAWTEQAVETMRRLWPTHSASQIAKAIHAEHGISFTRNAVIGKGLRTGMAAKRPPASPDGRASTGRRKLQFNSNHLLSRALKQSIKAVAIKESKPTADEQIPIYQRRTLMQLTSHTCKWPVGDPRNPDFFFCGSEPIPGHPYCCTHTERAWEKAKCRKSTTP